jgi:TonB-dependent starch-binding outer membrane protein SusC
MKIRVVFLILLSTLCICNINAQKSNKKITITGTVLNASKEPIVNAIIMIDDQKTNSMTDANGNYKVKVKPSASKIAIFTFGSGTFEDSIKGRTQIDFTFGKTASKQPVDQTAEPAEQGASTGYGLVKKRDLTTTTTTIDGTKKKYASYHSLAEMIEREVPGIRMNGTRVIIQGSKDLFGDVSAIIVVDGVTMDDIPDIPPTSVKSIDVLKGAAAAIYGSRAYGGAIVIKTKVQNN